MLLWWCIILDYVHDVCSEIVLNKIMNKLTATFSLLILPFLLSPLALRETQLPQRHFCVCMCFTSVHHPDLSGLQLIYLWMDFKIIWQQLFCFMSRSAICSFHLGSLHVWIHIYMRLSVQTTTPIFMDGFHSNLAQLFSFMSKWVI